MRKKINQMKDAIHNGNIVEVKSILTKNKDLLNYIMPIGSWLNIAVKFEKLDIIEYLLNEGIDTNIVIASNKGNCLIDAARTGNLTLIKYLLKRGIKLDCSVTDANPLFSAVDSNRMDVTLYLLKLEQKEIDKEQFKELTEAIIERSIIMGNVQLAKEIERNL